MSGYKVRLGDGSEIGPMDVAALKTWLAQGLVDGDSPVMRPHSRQWVPLHTVKELGPLGARRRPQATPAARRAPVASTQPDRGGAAEGDSLDRWRIGAVGVLLLASAVSVSYFAWRPQDAAPAFDGAPWLQLALAFLALGLAVLPGWPLARRIVRIALLVLAFLLFPVAGILVAQGERGTALLGLGAVWLLVSGLAALLAPVLRPLGLVLGLLPVVAGAVGAYHFVLTPESEAAQIVRSWSVAERTFSDASLGLALDVPNGWWLLKPGNPVVPASAETRITLAQPRQGGLAWLVAGPAPQGVTTPDQVLDRVAAQRRTERPGWQEATRENAVVGTLAGRRATATWTDAGVRQRELIVAGLDGWVGFALVAHMPEAVAARPDGLEPLAAGLAGRGLLAGRFRDSVEAALAAVPHLTRTASERLMAGSAARVLDPEQAFRRSVLALAKSLPELSKTESRELSALTSATYASIPWADRSRLSAYIERARKGDSTSPEDDRQMARLVKSAEDRLSPAQRLRLQAFYEKAILAQN